MPSSTISASRLHAPMMLPGLTDLSVEIMISRAAPKRRATAASVEVPNTLFCTTANGFISPSGTCLRAAAWKTISGRKRSKMSRTQPLVGHRSQHRHVPRRSSQRRQGVVDVIQILLGRVQQDERTRIQRLNTVRKGRANRPSRAGDKDFPARDKVGEFHWVVPSGGRRKQSVPSDVVEGKRHREVGIII